MSAAGAARAARVVRGAGRQSAEGGDRAAYLGDTGGRPAQAELRSGNARRGGSDAGRAGIETLARDRRLLLARRRGQHMSADDSAWRICSGWARSGSTTTTWSGTGTGIMCSGAKDTEPSLEFARGCPWACTFCNKTLFRNKFREREVEAVLAEVDRLAARGVDYIYFIDEIFGVGKNVRRLLEGMAERQVSIGFQTRIDLWDESRSTCWGGRERISMECGIESITDEGRDELNKNCRHFDRAA